MRGVLTDLAMESVRGGADTRGVRCSVLHRAGLELTTIRVETDEAARQLEKDKGVYVTISCDDLPRADARTKARVAAALARALRGMLPPEGEVLVVGLGNRNVTADALGTRVVEQLLVTRHLRGALPDDLRGRLRGVAAIAPGVLGVTGIETAEMVRGIASRIQPAAIIAIDALAAQDSRRICATVQLTDTGIRPGSGVGNHRLGLTEETLHVRVIAVGVPMVVYASTIARDALSRMMEEYGVMAGGGEERGDGAGRGTDGNGAGGGAANGDTAALLTALAEGATGRMVVTPREIDEWVRTVAQVLATGINKAIQTQLDDATIHALMH